MCKAWRDILSKKMPGETFGIFTTKSLHLSKAAFNLDDYHTYEDNTMVEEIF